jgi:hypothetical protein
MRGLKAILWACAIVIALPWAAFAQAGASITGTVRDSSGGVLPGVTVEATSPVLIQKVRSAVSDANGVYRITELLPGTYTVTFSLQGFTSQKLENIELSGSFVRTLNGELAVGNISDFVTVSGDAATVDLQNTTRQTVVTSETMSALPTGRNMFNLGVLIPGVTLTTGGLANQDVGGALGPNTLALGIHGGQTQDQRLTMNGVSLSTMIGGGWGGGTIPNTAGISEILFDTSAVDASLSTGGVRINFIAKEGGNRFSGTVFGNFANDSLQGDNYTSRVQALGLSTPGDIIKNWEFNPGFGGPLKQDVVWFYLSGQSRGAYRQVPGQSYNLNANAINEWRYAPDPSRSADERRSWEDYNARLTWQVNPKNKIGFLYNIQSNCFCPFGAGFLTAPEAGNDQRFPLQRPILLDWTSPVNSKLLLEATAIHRLERWGAYTLRTADDTAVDPRMISVVDNGPGAARPGMTYRAAPQYSNNLNTTFHYKASASYITGSHAFKVGFNDAWGDSDAGTTIEQPYSYVFNTPCITVNPCVPAPPTPAQVVLRAAPYTISTAIDHDLGFFVQDKWTAGRQTISLGVRIDHASASYPEVTLGPTLMTPDRNLSFPKTDSFSWNDWTPKLGYALDVFGTGKTALKISLNKYLRGVGTSFSQVPDPNPVSAAIGNGQATREWNDADRDFVPDCDLTTRTPGANGECGALSDPLFGANNSAAVLNQLTWDEDARTGWNKRGYNWEFSTGVQHEILPRVSLDVGFFRRWYGNFQVVDNLALSPSDFNIFSLTAPADSRLPNGGNYTVTGFAAIKPSVGFGGFVANQNKITLAKNYGDQSEVFNGFDINVNGRMENGVTFQGGTSTGRTSFDNCDVMNALPEVQFESNNFFSPNFFTTVPRQFCNRKGVFLTQVKGLVSYIIPKADVQLGVTLQSLPGVPIEARLNSPFNPNVGGLAMLPFAANFHVLEPGIEYGERVNQVDVKIGKLFRFGTTRTMVSLDLYNLFNVDTITAQNNTFTPGAQFPWQQASSILTARFVKIGAQFDW